jgi:hypothetical protein
VVFWSDIYNRVKLGLEYRQPMPTKVAKQFLSSNQVEGADEISRVLNDENAQSSIQEFIDFCSNTRIAKV